MNWRRAAVGVAVVLAVCVASLEPPALNAAEARGARGAEEIQNGIIPTTRFAVLAATDNSPRQNERQTTSAPNPERGMRLLASATLAFICVIVLLIGIAMLRSLRR